MKGADFICKLIQLSDCFVADKARRYIMWNSEIHSSLMIIYSMTPRSLIDLDYDQWP